MNYKYDIDTKEFLYSFPESIDPLATKQAGHDVFQVFSETTKIAPPVIPVNKVTVFENNKWVLKDDLRGKKYYSTVDKSEIVITAIGVLPENIHTEKKPLSENHEWVKDKWIESIDKIKQSKKLVTQNLIDSLEFTVFVMTECFEKKKSLAQIKEELCSNIDKLKTIEEVKNFKF